MLHVNRSLYGTGPQPPIQELSHNTSFDTLTEGVETGNLDAVKAALRNNADPNGWHLCSTVFHRACELGNIEIVRELLDKGARLDCEGWKMGDTPLHSACIYGQEQVVDELIRRGAPLYLRNRNHSRTPLEVAICSGQLNCCKRLIEAGADVNAVNTIHGSTPLTDACRNGDFDIVKLLLDFGANPDLCASIPPICEAVVFPKILQLLVDRRAIVHCRDASGHHTKKTSPLYRAADLGYEESVQILLKAGAKPSPINE